jgi:hypothetical protein
MVGISYHIWIWMASPQGHVCHPTVYLKGMETPLSARRLDWEMADGKRSVEISGILSLAKYGD